MHCIIRNLFIKIRAKRFSVPASIKIHEDYAANLGIPVVNEHNFCAFNVVCKCCKNILEGKTGFAGAKSIILNECYKVKVT